MSTHVISSQWLRLSSFFLNELIMAYSYSMMCLAKHAFPVFTSFVWTSTRIVHLMKITLSRAEISYDSSIFRNKVFLVKTWPEYDRPFIRISFLRASSRPVEQLNLEMKVDIAIKEMRMDGSKARHWLMVFRWCPAWVPLHTNCFAIGLLHGISCHSRLVLRRYMPIMAQPSRQAPSGCP